jgi:hypothetical protein
VQAALDRDLLSAQVLCERLKHACWGGMEHTLMAVRGMRFDVVVHSYPTCPREVRHRQCASLQFLHSVEKAEFRAQGRDHPLDRFLVTTTDAATGSVADGAGLLPSGTNKDDDAVLYTATELHTERRRIVNSILLAQQAHAVRTRFNKHFDTVHHLKQQAISQVADANQRLHDIHVELVCMGCAVPPEDAGSVQVGSFCYMYGVVSHSEISHCRSSSSQPSSHGCNIARVEGQHADTHASRRAA